MVSAPLRITGRKGEMMQQSGDQNRFPEHQNDSKTYLLKCLETRGARNIQAIIDDEAVLRFGKYTKLTGMSEASVATYLASIYKVCAELNTTPTKLVNEIANSNGNTQSWFNDLAEHFLFKRSNPLRGSSVRSIHDSLVKLLEANDIHVEVQAKFQVRTRKPIPFTRDEVKTILKSVQNNKRKALWVWLLAQSFARPGVLCTLTLGDFIDMVETGKQADLIWIDGEQRHTKERVSHDLPVSPEVLRAVKALIADLEKTFKFKITRENAGEFPIVACAWDPRRKMNYLSFLVEMRRTVHETGVQGTSTGNKGATRYLKDVHTGFRGFCFTQWNSHSGNVYLGKFFAGQRVPLDAYNYIDFKTVDPKEKLAAYLRCRPKLFEETDFVEEACTQLRSLGFEIDSKIRNLLRTRLVTGGERQAYRADRVNCTRKDAPD